jgi:signal transduction histidine kinase/CheY-like chemotaxis protein
MRENYEIGRTYSHKNFRHIKKDGSVIWVEPSTHDLVLNGRRVRFAAIVDVTERVKSEERQLELMNKLQDAKQEAERANELKSAFLANMSHEIRTPLGAMMGFADLLKDPGLTAAERQSFTDILSRNGESLSVIINDILDLSKVEAGHLTLEYTDTFPEQIGADVVSLLRVKASEKDLVLNYTHDESCPKSIISDPIRVRQILLNLVSNAIKFTQFGSVNIKSFARKTDRGSNALCFEVSDTGIGIPKHQQEKIFEMFVQADGSMTRRFGGTGLGLALSRSLARAMGGDIAISATQEGVGSTFLVTIEDRPERKSEHREKPAPDVTHQELTETALQGLKILVVDDAPDNQKLIWRYLTRYGAVVESADNGLIGYRAAIAGDFDLVLMDIQMPVMDGYSATQKLREVGYLKPIVALTAHAMNEVRKKALNVGYTEHLTKPINSKELVYTIARLTKR